MSNHVELHLGPASQPPSLRRRAPNEFVHMIIKSFQPDAEASLYGAISGTDRDYDKTFGIDSVAHMEAWTEANPGKRGAILDIGGYGVAPNDLIARLVKRNPHILIPYGLSVAEERNPKVQTPYADCVAGDMADFYFSDGGDTGEVLQHALARNGCEPNGVALLYMRPLLGYIAMEVTHNIKDKRGSGHYLDFYHDMYQHLVQTFLAVGGKAVIEMPPYLLPDQRAAFRNKLEESLGNQFSLAPYYEAHLPATYPPAYQSTGQDTHFSLAITRKQ